MVDLIFITDSIIKNVPIKYDLYNNVVIAKKEEGSTIVIDRRFYRGFIYKNDGVKKLYLRLKPSDFTFYHVLFRTSDFVFYKTNKTRIEKNNRYVPGLDIKPQKFLHRSDYFVIQNDVAYPVKLRNGEAVAYFPIAYATQIPKLKKQLNIKKLRKEEDYIKIINAFAVP